jgi:hypothetical protein
MPKYEYGVGTVIHSDVKFSNPDETDEPVDWRTRHTLLDPTTVTVTLTRPDDTQEVFTYPTDGEIIRQGQGSYRFVLTLSMSGTHKWTWLGANATRAITFHGECDAT